MTETQTPTPTLDQWKANKRHSVTLPSGTIVEIELPHIEDFITAGDLPNSLLAAAQQFATGGSPPAQFNQADFEQQAEFMRFLVSKTVVNPSITPDDVKDLPFEDVEMLLDFASRNRDVDAVGHHLAGLEVNASFRRFRGLDSGDAFGGGV